MSMAAAMPADAAVRRRRPAPCKWPPRVKDFSSSPVNAMRAAANISTNSHDAASGHPSRACVMPPVGAAAGAPWVGQAVPLAGIATAEWVGCVERPIARYIQAIAAIMARWYQRRTPRWWLSRGPSEKGAGSGTMIW